MLSDVSLGILDQKVRSMEKRMEKAEAFIEKLDDRLDAQEKFTSRIEIMFEGFEQRITMFEKKIDTFMEMLEQRNQATLEAAQEASKQTSTDWKEVVVELIKWSGIIIAGILGFKYL